MNRTNRGSLYGASGLTAALCGVVIAVSAGAARPVSPQVARIVVQPSAITLADARDARSFVVTGKRSDGSSVDLSVAATVKPTEPIVRVDRDGFIVPLRVGKTTVTVTAGGARATVPVQVVSLQSPPVSFVRDVMPILSKAGCNAGTCHGSAKGKNGFKLSLRGYDPDFDHHALVDDVSGRRFNRSDPSQSLMLLKSTGSVPHRGGVVITPDSRYYAVLKQWIAEGAANDSDYVKRVSSLEVLPAIPNVTLPQMEQRTVVIAHYPGGLTRDVTREAVLTSSVPEIATVSPAGEITAVRRGEAALLVRYEGTYATNTITVLGDRKGYHWASAPEINYIDRLVDAKLKKIKALPSSECDDPTFLRRVSIDLTGLPPASETTRAFLADKTPTLEKRTRLVEKLMSSPEFVDRWTNKWADLLDCNSKFLGAQGVRKFRNWIHSAVAENMPYDQFVRTLITASGDANENAAANYLRVIRDTSTATENVTQLFLGVRFS